MLLYTNQSRLIVAKGPAFRCLAEWGRVVGEARSQEGEMESGGAGPAASAIAAPT